MPRAFGRGTAGIYRISLRTGQGFLDIRVARVTWATETVSHQDYVTYCRAGYAHDDYESNSYITHDADADYRVAQARGALWLLALGRPSRVAMQQLNNIGQRWPVLGGAAQAWRLVEMNRTARC